MAFINSSQLLLSSDDSVHAVDMITLQEQTYASLFNHKDEPVYIGHGTQQVRFNGGYGITFDGNRTVYVSQSVYGRIMAINTVTDQVTNRIYSSLAHLYKLYFDSITSGILTTIWDDIYKRYNICKLKLESGTLSYLLSRSSAGSVEIGEYWRTDIVRLNGTVWLVVDRSKANK